MTCRKRSLKTIGVILVLVLTLGKVTSALAQDVEMFSSDLEQMRRTLEEERKAFDQYRQEARKQMEAARGQTDLDAILKQLGQQGEVPVDRSSWEIRICEVDPATVPFLPLLEAALPPGSRLDMNPEIKTLAIFTSPDGLEKTLEFVEAIAARAGKQRYEAERYEAEKEVKERAKDNQVTTAAPWASGTDLATAKSVMLEILLLKGIPKQGPPAGAGFGTMGPGGAPGLYGGGYAAGGGSRQGASDVAVRVGPAEEQNASGVPAKKAAGEAGPPKPPEFNKDAREMGLTEEDLRFLGDRGWFTLGRATVLTQSGKTFEIKVGQHLFQGDLLLAPDNERVLLNINVSGPDTPRGPIGFPGMGYPGGGMGYGPMAPGMGSAGGGYGGMASGMGGGPGGPSYPVMGAKGADLKIQDSGLELRSTALLDLDCPAILGGGGSEEPTLVVVRPRLWIRTKAEQPETVKQ